ncbi:Phox homologous domain-containing protein [Podospora conica]|nr:Phox homologous domain-containing protein [Schizothecium conicum]
MAPPIEISIPTTSLSNPPDNSKPYTLYNITLRLPLRSFVVQKRYSDFITLHQTLTALVGAPPPAPIPPKTWFKSTISSPELTEQRRRNLEAYLRAIAEPPDRRWRDTPAWRAFLNLPGGAAPSTSGMSVDARVPAIARDNALAAASDPGIWLDLHREMKACLHDARVALGRRDAADSSARALDASSQAKRAIIKAGGLIAALADGLRALQEGGRLGDGEVRRRRDLVAAARAERDGLDRGRVLGAPLPETERTRERDNEGVLELQREQMREQDEDVEALARVIRRQREMGLAIYDEVERQVDMLGRMEGDVDGLGRKVEVAKKRADKLR